MEKLTVIEREGPRGKYNVVAYEQIADFYERGILKIVLPIADENRRERRTKSIDATIRRTLERKLKTASEETEEYYKYEHMSDDIPNAIEYFISTDFDDPITGDIGQFVIELNTNEIVPYHWDTNKRMVTQDKIFIDGERVDVDIPSGKMIMGYYSTFEVFEDKAEIEDGDYFGSEIEKKKFFEYYAQKNAAVFYQGYFNLYQDEKKENEYIFAQEGYIIDTVGEMPWKKVSDIENDKMTIFCDFDAFLKEAKEKNLDISHIIESNGNDVDIIDVEPGRYRFSIWDKGKHVKQTADEEPDEKMRETLYSYYGGITKID